MARVLPFPEVGDVLLDARGDDRSLRVSWHHDAGVVVLSLWRGGSCSGSFRLQVADVPDLIDALAQGLADGYGTGTRTDLRPIPGP